MTLGVRRSEGRRVVPAVIAAAAAAVAVAAGCGSGAPDEDEAKAVALKALAAYDSGDAKTLCALTPAAKRAQFTAPTTCLSFYGALFIQQSGQDAIDQAMRPFRPGKVTGVRQEGDRTIVEVTPAKAQLTPLQRRGVRLRYGRQATALGEPIPFPVTVIEEDGRLVAGF